MINPAFWNKMHQWYRILPIMIVLVGCRNNRMEEVALAAPSCFLPDTISFQHDIVPIFVSNCALPDCHSGKFPQGNLNLEASKAYAQLMKKGSGYVDTLHPKNSVLYSSMISVSDPMPPTGKLDDCTIAYIEKWMIQKAKNN